MDSITLELLIENGGIAIPFILAMWTRMEMGQYKIARLTRRIGKVEDCIEDVKEQVSDVQEKVSKVRKKIASVLAIIFVLSVSGCAAWQTKAENVIIEAKSCMHQCAQKCIMMGVTKLVQGDLKGGYADSAVCVENCVRVCALSTAGKCLIK